MRSLRAMLLLIALAACQSSDDQAGRPVAVSYDSIMKPIAEQYVKLVLAVGEHDPNYVDAYYGPAEWRDAAKAQKPTLDSIDTQAARLLQGLDSVNVDNAEELTRLRKTYLAKQLQSLRGYVSMLEGTRMKFDEESQALYDVQAPTHDEAHFRSLIDSLTTMLPGSGPIPARLERFKRAFVIPPAKLDTVFKVAIAEARRRTAANIQLPAGEEFTLEYVKNKSWSGYNWYQGNLKSLIQINTDLPIFIDRAVDLAAHEGYPGHHVYNALLEHHLVRGRGWPEYAVYPLYSPQSLIAEGSANYGIEVAFPGAERTAFEKSVLYPLAGLDSTRADEYNRVMEVVGRLSYAGNEAARKYLNGEINADSAAKWINSYALMEPARAQQRVKFIDTYRSYVINYNYGKDLVRDYVEGKSGGNAERRWREFATLLSSPRLPSSLRAQ